MNVNTLKTCIKLVKKFAGNSKYVLEFEGLEKNILYRFTINSKYISLEVENPNFIMKIDDIDSLKLMDSEFNPVKLVITSFVNNVSNEGKVLEESILNINYEAQFYLKLFKIVGEYLYFTFESEKVFYEAIYIDGKVLVMSEDDESIVVDGTNLFKMWTKYKDYKILNVSVMHNKKIYSKLMKDIEYCACKTNRRLVLYKFGMKVRDEYVTV